MGEAPARIAIVSDSSGTGRLKTMASRPTARAGDQHETAHAATKSNQNWTPVPPDPEANNLHSHAADQGQEGTDASPVQRTERDHHEAQATGKTALATRRLTPKTAPPMPCPREGLVIMSMLKPSARR